MKRLCMPRVVTTLTAIFLLSSCTVTRPVQHRWERARYGAYMVPQATAMTVNDQAAIANLCPAGMPQALPQIDLGSTEYAVHRSYALEYSNDLKIPIWVCEHLTASSVSGTLTGRTSGFTPDPEIKGPHSFDDDYVGSGYDRGHNAPNADMTVDPKARRETFYLSNVVPQVKENNERVWKSLETMVRAWAKTCGDIWVITGSVLYDPKEERPETADGWVQYDAIGKDGVAVPTHFYKIVVQRKGHTWSALTFFLENKAYGTPYDWRSYIVSLRWLQDRSGLDFMPDLDPSTAEVIESVANTQWNGDLSCSW
jgi:endonuclease G, mitochondrial